VALGSSGPEQNLILKQFIIQFTPKSSVKDTKYLLSLALDLESHLSSKSCSSDIYSSDCPILSPLKLWNHSMDSLMKDEDPLMTMSQAITRREWTQKTLDAMFHDMKLRDHEISGFSSIILSYALDVTNVEDRLVLNRWDDRKWSLPRLISFKDHSPSIQQHLINFYRYLEVKTFLFDPSRPPVRVIS
jgi:hypothetical protein